MMTIHPEFDENELKAALGDEDQPPDPSSTHVNQLRLKLRSMTMDSHSVDYRPAPSHGKRLAVYVRVAALAATSLFVLFAIQNYSNTAAASLRTALDATRRHSWIHSTTTITQVGETVELESWCAPAQRLTAFRLPQMLNFIDYAEGIQSSYSEKTDTIFRWRAEMNGEEMGRAFINALLSHGDISSSFPCHNVSAVKKTSVSEKGIAWTLYSFQLELKTVPKVHWETQIRTNSASGEIETWEEVHSDGTRVLTRFDYPSDGPTDIFALGANRHAKIIDRVASSDIVQLSKEFQKQIRSFDNYEALVVDRVIDDDENAVPLLRVVRREGMNFSVNLLQPVEADFILPDVIDLEWWKSNRQNLRPTSLASCDGEICTIYPYSSDSARRYAATEMPWSNKVTTFPVFKLKDSIGATTVPVWPSLWPEYACRPFLVTTDPTLKFDIDPTGTDGPPNTQRIRLLAPDSPFAKERANYWLALDPTRCVLKSIIALPSFSCPSNGPTEKFVVSEFSQFMTSPKGFAFATERVSRDATSQGRMKRLFLVDFDLN